MISEILSGLESRMSKTIEDLNHELASVRTGRASVHLLDQIRVDYYGTLTPLNQLATLHVPEPTLITVQPWDTSQIGTIEKAILAGNLGLNPSNDGKLIRVPVPPLTQERREEMAKTVGRVAEEHRTAVRNIRRDGNDQLKRALKNKEISEDQEYRSLTKVQEITDKFIKMIDEAAEAKEKEILEV